ncbi:MULTISPECIES: hypothetical protein [Burkholderia cepacia complex]|uniref:hypothetical protein n=1 Tax=Burkholderia cepacia complex TaxID=87882 RepID=UPI0012BB0E37|nr:MULTISPECIES: hypothetical protein [Burkholderia cepacia complex]
MTGDLRRTLDEIGRRIATLTIAGTRRSRPRTTPRPARSDVSSGTTIPRNVSLTFRATFISASTLHPPRTRSSIGRNHGVGQHPHFIFVKVEKKWRVTHATTPINVHVSPHPPHAPSVLTPTTQAIARPTRLRPAP